MTVFTKFSPQEITVNFLYGGTQLRSLQEALLANGSKALMIREHKHFPLLSYGQGRAYFAASNKQIWRALEKPDSSSRSSQIVNRWNCEQPKQHDHEQTEWYISAPNHRMMNKPGKLPKIS